MGSCWDSPDTLPCSVGRSGATAEACQPVQSIVAFMDMFIANSTQEAGRLKWKVVQKACSPAMLCLPARGIRCFALPHRCPTRFEDSWKGANVRCWKLQMALACHLAAHLAAVGTSDA